MTAALHHESYFRAILESLYTGLSDLDVQGYQQSASDGWTQARITGDFFQHLEARITIDGIEERSRDEYVYNAGLAFMCRMQPDDDSLSQARLLAATLAAFEFLDGWRHANARAVPLSSTPLESEAGPEWALVEIPFQLRIPRG